MSDGNDRLSRRERERMMRRQAMLDAARSVIAEKGYARATLDEIAERAEFGKGTLYNYFEGGKEEILFAIFEEIYDDICTLIQDIFLDESATDRPLRDAFHAFVKAFFDFSREREEFFMILTKEAHRLAFSEESDRARFFQEQRDRMVNALTPALERAMERGEIQSLPPEAVAHMLLANVNGMTVHRCLANRQCDCHEDTLLHQPDNAADFLTTMLFDGLTLNPSTAPSSSALSTNE